jgi:hypothetical protein
MAARLALLRAQRQLYQDAGVHIHVRNFAVINQVGAFSLHATLNCEAFATEHSSTAHFDVKSFVGLAWRPAGEPICCGKPHTQRPFELILNIQKQHGFCSYTLRLCCVRRDLRHGTRKVSLASTLLFYIVRTADTSF